MNKKDIKKLINDISNSVGCRIQHNNCPCGTCFRSRALDYSHLSWLLLLCLRGDYTYEDVKENLNECLRGEQLI